MSRPSLSAGSRKREAENMQQGTAWYAIWTRSRHEQVVREQLERKGIEAFLPTITKWSRWKDRKKQIDWPLFPGYCFVRFNGADRLPVLKCSGVVNIVSLMATSSVPGTRFETPPARPKEISIRSVQPHSWRHDRRSHPRPLKGSSVAWCAKGRTPLILSFNGSPGGHVESARTSIV